MIDPHVSNDATTNDADQETPEEALLEEKASQADISDLEADNLDQPDDSKRREDAGDELLDEEELKQRELDIMRDEDSPISKFPRE